MKLISKNLANLYFQVKWNKNVKIDVKYFGSTAPFLSYNGSDKNDNEMELHLLQKFLNDQNLNNNRNNTKSYLKTNPESLFNKNCTKICPTRENAGTIKLVN